LPAQADPERATRARRQWSVFTAACVQDIQRMADGVVVSRAGKSWLAGRCTSSPPPGSLVRDRGPPPAGIGLLDALTHRDCLRGARASQPPCHGRLRGRQHQRPAPAADHPADPQQDERRPPVNRREPGQIENDATGFLCFGQLEQPTKPTLSNATSTRSGAGLLDSTSPAKVAASMASSASRAARSALNSGSSAELAGRLCRGCADARPRG
jgi:hypothetical protein